MELEPRAMKRVEMLARRREESGQGRGWWRLRFNSGQFSTLSDVGGSFMVSGTTPELQRHWVDWVYIPTSPQLAGLLTGEPHLIGKHCQLGFCWRREIVLSFTHMLQAVLGFFLHYTELWIKSKISDMVQTVELDMCGKRFGAEDKRWARNEFLWQWLSIQCPAAFPHRWPLKHLEIRQAAFVCWWWIISMLVTLWQSFWQARIARKEVLDVCSASFFGEDNCYNSPLT